MRVLLVVTRLNVGGPAGQVLALADGLDPQRFEVEVAAGALAPGEADFLALRAPNLGVRAVPGLGRAVRAGSDAVALGQLRRLVRRWRPHVVHTHTAKGGVLGRLAARSARVPSVHTFHGHLLHGYFGPRTTQAVVAAERRLAPRTGRLISVGTRVRDELLAAGIGRPEQFVVVPPGVAPSPEVAPATARQRLGLPAGAAVIGYVGRLTAIKRPDRLLEVAARLRDRDRPVTLLLAGDGERRDDLERQARRDRLDVAFLGWRADVETVHAASDVAVLASDNEGMPVSLIEAALAGVPAVATDVGSVAEVVADGETGLVVPGEAASVTDAVARLLDDEALRAQMGARAAARARERFAPATLVRDTAEIYASLHEREHRR